MNDDIIMHSKQHLKADHNAFKNLNKNPDDIILIHDAVTATAETLKNTLGDCATGLSETTGMCEQLALIHLTSELIDKIKEQLADECALAVAGGDRQSTVATAAGKLPGSLFRADSQFQIMQKIDEYRAKNKD